MNVNNLTTIYDINAGCPPGRIVVSHDCDVNTRTVEVFFRQGVIPLAISQDCTAKAAFEFWRAGINAEKDKIYRYGDDIHKCIQPHTTQDDWTPDKVPALFVKISLEEFPQWVQPVGAEDAYMKGAKVSDEGEHWISDIDNNVWKPGVYGWSKYPKDA